jgi:hypothetical protein
MNSETDFESQRDELIAEITAAFDGVSREAAQHCTKPKLLMIGSLMKSAGRRGNSIPSGDGKMYRMNIFGRVAQPFLFWM